MESYETKKNSFVRLRALRVCVCVHRSSTVGQLNGGRPTDQRWRTGKKLKKGKRERGENWVNVCGEIMSEEKKKKKAKSLKPALKSVRDFWSWEKKSKREQQQADNVRPD